MALQNTRKTEAIEDGAPSDMPGSHREQFAIATEVANLRSESGEARREWDAVLQNWSKEELSEKAAFRQQQCVQGYDWAQLDRILLFSLFF